MKFATLLVIFLTFSLISLDVCSALTRSHRYRRAIRSRRTHTRYTPTTRLGAFFYSAFINATGVDDSKIDNLIKCFPLQWTNSAEEKKTEQIPDQPPAPAKEEERPLWQEILLGIGKVINFFCKYKDKIKSLFSRRIRRQLRRKSHRMFLQSSLARYRRTAGFWSSIWEKAKSAVKSVVQTVQGVIDWAQTKWEEVSAFANTIISNLTAIWEAFKIKIRGMFPKIAGFIDRVVAFHKCVQDGKAVWGSIKDFVGNVITTIRTFIQIFAGDLVSLAGYLIDLLCNWEIVKDAFVALFDGLKENDPIKKYTQIGKFAGLIAKALTKKLLRQRHHKL